MSISIDQRLKRYNIRIDGLAAIAIGFQKVRLERSDGVTVPVEINL